MLFDMFDSRIHLEEEISKKSQLFFCEKEAGLCHKISKCPLKIQHVNHAIMLQR